MSLLVVFATLFCGSTLFVHHHADLNGHSVTHSHPWLPGSTHSHTQQQNVTIDEINNALLTMELARTVMVDAPVMTYVHIENGVKASFADGEHVCAVGRAPPMI